VHQRRVDWVIWHLTRVVEQYYTHKLTLLAQGETPRGVYVELLHLMDMTLAVIVWTEACLSLATELAPLQLAASMQLLFTATTSTDTHVCSCEVASNDGM
jgi:hypothetical protein